MRAVWGLASPHREGLKPAGDVGRSSGRCGCRAPLRGRGLLLALRRLSRRRRLVLRPLRRRGCERLLRCLDILMPVPEHCGRLIGLLQLARRLLIALRRSILGLRIAGWRYGTGNRVILIVTCSGSLLVIRSCCSSGRIHACISILRRVGATLLWKSCEGMVCLLRCTVPACCGRLLWRLV